METKLLDDKVRRWENEGISWYNCIFQRQDPLWLRLCDGIKEEYTKHMHYSEKSCNLKLKIISTNKTKQSKAGIINDL